MTRRDLARQLHQDSTTDKTLGQCRIDAFCDLLLGHAEVQTTVNVLVPVKTGSATSRTSTDTGAPADAGTGGNGSGAAGNSLVEAMFADINWDAALRNLVLDLDHQDDHATNATLTDSPPGDSSPTDGPSTHSPPEDHAAAAPPPPTALPARLCLPDVEIPGIGVIPADTVQDLLATLGTRLTRSLVHWRTGTLIETGATTYRPTDRIRRFVLQRDVHCRFPGCDRPARFCDVDHVTPWPHGPTEPANLQALCRHHHRAKHETRWNVTTTPHGACTWTSPTGREYTTHPGSQEVTADLHVTPAAAPVRHAPDESDLLDEPGDPTAA